jgi:hypothetical protein
VIFVGPPERQDVFQAVIVPNQQEQVRQKHQRGDASSFKPDGIGPNTNVQEPTTKTVQALAEKVG